MSVTLGPRGTRGGGIPKLALTILKLLQPLNVAMFHRFGRRMRVQGRPLLLLTTTGAKTGMARHTTLVWFPDERTGSWLIVASNSGAATHPKWAFNLAKHPQAAIELDGSTHLVRAETLAGDERERAWKNVVELAPAFGKYAETTDRVIPIIRLAKT